MFLGDGCSTKGGDALRSLSGLESLAVAFGLLVRHIAGGGLQLKGWVIRRTRCGRVWSLVMRVKTRVRGDGIKVSLPNIVSDMDPQFL